jgi:hypothetical protein
MSSVDDAATGRASTNDADLTGARTTPRSSSSRVSPATKPSAPRLLLTKREAAHALGMSVRHFERHVQTALRCVHSGSLTLYLVRDLERWAHDEATFGGRAAQGVR